jgi:pSer/pThr/pTyr-binding forkhead associated (FHA) protein
MFDLESSNGVFLNGVRVHSAALHEGDVIQIGDAVLVFREGGG